MSSTEECVQKFDRNKKLVEAADSGDNERVTRLLQEGADITSRNSDRDTGLHLSTRGGYKDVLLTFIAHKVDLNIRGAAQMTALMIASTINQPEIIGELLAHGADDQIQDYQGRDALKCAENENSQDAVKVLKSRKEDPYKVTKQIMGEAKNENVNWGLVKGIIAAHPDINHLNKNRETALRLAWKAENIKLVKLLLDRGAKFDVQNADGKTSLQIEQYIEKNDVKKRENVLDLMIEYDQKRNQEALEDSQFRIKKEIKKIVPTSGNLRDCLKSISDKYPWSEGKYKVMLGISFLLQVIRGSFFFGLDVATDIQFTLDMMTQAKRNFLGDFAKCQHTFENHFDAAIEVCKMHFDKNMCREAIDQVFRPKKVPS